MAPSELKSPAAPNTGETESAAVSSAELLAGRRQLIIQHGAVQYRLRLTSSNKLILTK